MVEFAQSVIHYSRNYKPYERAIETLAVLKADQEELDKRKEETKALQEAQSLKDEVRKVLLFTCHKSSI